MRDCEELVIGWYALGLRGCYLTVSCDSHDSSALWVGWIWSFEPHLAKSFPELSVDWIPIVPGSWVQTVVSQIHREIWSCLHTSLLVQATASAKGNAMSATIPWWCFGPLASCVFSSSWRLLTTCWLQRWRQRPLCSSPPHVPLGCSFLCCRALVLLAPWRWIFQLRSTPFSGGSPS